MSYKQRLAIRRYELRMMEIWRRHPEKYIVIRTPVPENRLIFLDAKSWPQEMPD